MESTRPKTIEGVALGAQAVGDLKARLRGPLICPEDPGYDEARSLWNAMIDRRPALIARCRGVADVITGVNFAREHRLPLSIKGGGHNIAGLAVGDQALMLDMSLMQGVWVDPNARTVRAQAGCLLGDVDRETQVYGLATVLGFISNTGIAGLTLGGGLGYLTRRFGWACDNVLSMEVVTAEGRIVRASEKENADLFWGLRGGGGNFGVVTNFEYKLYPVGPEIIGGAIAWRAEDAGQVLALFGDVTEHAPPELTVAAILRMAPPVPWLPKKVHGKPIVALLVCYSGPLAEGERRVASIKRFGSPVGDVVEQRSYVSQQSLLDATQPKGRRYYWKSEYLSQLSTQLLSEVSEQAQRMMSPHSLILLFPMDGAINQLPQDHSAVGNREARLILTIAGSWDQVADDEPNIEWVRRAWRQLRRYSTGGTYINFLTEEEGDERIHAAYGKNYARLVGIKTEWDPENLFRMNKNIAPQVAPPNHM